MPQNVVLAKWLVDKIWSEDSILTHKIWDKKIIVNTYYKNHKEAINWVLEMLINWEIKTISSLSEIEVIWHRVVHWWEYFSQPTVINDDVIKKIEECEKLAPLHNPAAKAWIIACRDLIPDIKQVAVFDTAFHQSMKKENYLYAIPNKYYDKYKIRRYWFHWTSHDYVSSRVSELINIPRNELKIITCHIGNWASITAINNWIVNDTSMWFTPLEWLIMWTRSWDIDPALIPFLMKNENLSTEEVDDILNKQSWILWLSWITSDMRDIEDWFIAWDKESELILNIYLNRIIKYIWAYIAEMNWVDVIIFTAWVFENAPIFRKIVLEKLSWFWIKIDYNANETRWKEVEISTPDSKIKVFVIPTNEEYIIAKSSYILCN